MALGNRYMRKGISALYFLPACVALGAPTQAEITAGTDLSDDTAEINGATFANEPIDTPNLKDTFTSKISGEDKADDPDLTLYERDGSTPTVWTALAKGTVGYLALLPLGKASTKPSEVWPVTVASRARVWSTGNDPAQFRVVFATNAVPNTNGVQAA